MRPRGGDHPVRGANEVDDQASAMAMTVREYRGVVHAFSTSTRIHGMKNLYLAQGERSENWHYYRYVDTGCVFAKFVDVISINQSINQEIFNGAKIAISHDRYNR